MIWWGSNPKSSDLRMKTLAICHDISQAIPKDNVTVSTNFFNKLSLYIWLNVLHMYCICGDFRCITCVTYMSYRCISTQVINV